MSGLIKRNVQRYGLTRAMGKKTTYVFLLYHTEPIVEFEAEVLTLTEDQMSIDVCVVVVEGTITTESRITLNSGDIDDSASGNCSFSNIFYISDIIKF